MRQLTSPSANFGFSLGINDVIPGPKLRAMKEKKVEAAYAECVDLIAKAKKGLLENKPGCNQEQTLEALISAVLSKVRDEVGKVCMEELSRHNAPLIMATCGSKGERNKTRSRSTLIRYQTQALSSTFRRWSLVWDSRSSLGNVFQTVSRTVRFHIFPKNPKSHPQRVLCGIVSTLVFYPRNFCSTPSQDAKVW